MQSGFNFSALQSRLTSVAQTILDEVAPLPSTAANAPNPKPAMVDKPLSTRASPSTPVQTPAAPPPPPSTLALHPVGDIKPLQSRDAVPLPALPAVSAPYSSASAPQVHITSAPSKPATVTDPTLSQRILALEKEKAGLMRDVASYEEAVESMRQEFDHLANEHANLQGTPLDLHTKLINHSHDEGAKGRRRSGIVEETG